MNITRESLLKSIAEHGYNIGFGAKRHFKSYDILNKMPDMLSFFTIVIGIFQLIEPFKNSGLCSDIVSAVLIIIGITSLLIDKTSYKKEEYKNAGEKLIRMFNRLRDLYNAVEFTEYDSKDLQGIYNEVQKIVDEASNIALSDQIMFSNLLAHIGFFYETQIDWIDEQLHFNFFKDKVPTSVKVWIAIIVLVISLVILIKIKE